MHDPAKWNLLCGWTWILLAFASGMIIGLRFHQDDWAGGYNSWRRRLLRLGHISFFGLGAINILFYLTVQSASLGGTALAWASAALILGALSMPAACFLAASDRRWKNLFALPVGSLLIAAALTLFTILSL